MCDIIYAREFKRERWNHEDTTDGRTGVPWISRLQAFYMFPRLRKYLKKKTSNKQYFINLATGNGEYLWLSVAFVQAWIKSNMSKNVFSRKHICAFKTTQVQQQAQQAHPPLAPLVVPEFELQFQVDELDSSCSSSDMTAASQQQQQHTRDNSSSRRSNAGSSSFMMHLNNTGYNNSSTTTKQSFE